MGSTTLSVFRVFAMPRKLSLTSVNSSRRWLKNHRGKCYAVSSVELTQTTHLASQHRNLRPNS
jgi:hypothetical protein